MKLVLRPTGVASPLTPSFFFAGFGWPRYVARMACGPSALRTKWSSRKFCGEYYHAPKPDHAGTGRGYYLAGAGQPFTRWEWCDDVRNVCIDHTGWFCSEHGDKVRGIVVRLPHGRFLAGWSMGRHMASGVAPGLHQTAQAAAYAADREAKDVADREWSRQSEVDQC